MVDQSNLIFVFGDSISWGAFDSEKGGWVERLKISFFGGNTFVYGLGIESNTSEDLLRRFEGELRARLYYPDDKKYGYVPIIIFEIGKNDSLYNRDKNDTWVKIDKFEENLRDLILTAKKYSKNILFIGLAELDEMKTIPWDKEQNYCNENILNYNDKIKIVCEKEGVIFISLLDLLSKEDLHDGLHPNSEGHEKIFKRVKEHLVKEVLV